MTWKFLYSRVLHRNDFGCWKSPRVYRAPRDRCGSTFRNFHTPSLPVRFHRQPPPQGQRPPNKQPSEQYMKDMLSGLYRPLDRLSDENAELSDSPGAGNALLFASSRGVRGHVRDKYCQHSQVLKLPWRGYGSSRKYFLYQRTRYRRLSFSESRRKKHTCRRISCWSEPRQEYH